jgi:hypothetical protein
MITPAYKIIDLAPDGQSNRTVSMGTVVIQLVTKYNYSASCWTMDILDSLGNLMLAGLMLVPNVDILKPYTALKESLGSLVLIEVNAGDYQSPDLLGINTVLLWFPSGTEVELPI